MTWQTILEVWPVFVVAAVAVYLFKSIIRPPK